MHHASIAILLHSPQQLWHPAIGEMQLRCRSALRQLTLRYFMRHLQSIPISSAQHQHLLFAHPARAFEQELPTLPKPELLILLRQWPGLVPVKPFKNVTFG